MGALDGYLAAPLFWLLGRLGPNARAGPRAPRAGQRRPDGAPGARCLRAAGCAVHGGPAGGPARTSSCSGPTRPAITTRSRSCSGPSPSSSLCARPPRRAGGRLSCSRCWAGASGSPSGPTSSRSSTSRRSRSCSCAAASGPLVPRVLAALPAFALGSLPHWLYGVPHGTALPPPGRPVGLETVLAHLALLRKDGLAHRGRRAAEPPGRALGVGLALALGALYLAAALAALRAVRRAAPPRGARRAWPSWPSRAPTSASRWRRSTAAASTINDPHYLLPLYTALPPLLGAFLAGLSDRRRARVLTAARPPAPRGRRPGGQLREPPSGHRGGRARRARGAARDRRGASSAPAFTGSTIPTPRAACSPSCRRAGRSSRIPTRRFDPASRAPSTARRPPPGGCRGARRRSRRTSPRSALRFTFRPREPRSAASTRASRWSAPPVREVAPARSGSPPATARAAHRPHDGPHRRDALEHRPAPAGRRVDPGGPGRASCPSRSSAGCRARTRRCPGASGSRAPSTAPRGSRWWTCPSTAGRSTGRPGGPSRACGADGWSSACRRRRPAISASRRRAGRGLGVDDPGAVRVRGDGRRRGPARGGRCRARARASEPRASSGSTPTTAGPAASPWPIPAIRVPPANLQLDDYGCKGSAGACSSRPSTGNRRHRGPAGADRRRGLRRGGPARAGSRSRGAAVGGLALFVHAPPPQPGPRLPARAIRVTASRHPKRARAWRSTGSGDALGHRGPRAAGRLVPRRPPGRPVASRRAARGGQPRRSTAGARRGGLARRRALGAPRRDAPAGAPVSMGRLRHPRRRGLAVRLDFPPATVRALRLVLPAGDPVFDWSINELAVYGGE